MKQINFAHAYHKLQQQRFTTIRRASNLKKYRLGEIVEIADHTGFVLFTAKIVKLVVCEIAELSLDTIKKDAEYPGFEIKNHVDFLALMNSFRLFRSPLSLNDKVLGITLEKEGKGE